MGTGGGGGGAGGGVTRPQWKAAIDFKWIDHQLEDELTRERGGGCHVGHPL